MSREIELIDSIDERIKTHGIVALNIAELNYWAVWCLMFEAYDGEEITDLGAFYQYFRSASGELSHHALTGLEAIGAIQPADIFQSVIMWGLQRRVTLLAAENPTHDRS